MLSAILRLRERKHVNAFFAFTYVDLLCIEVVNFIVGNVDLNSSRDGQI